MNLNPNTPLWQLTVGEFEELMRSTSTPIVPPPTEVVDFVEKKYLYGLGALARFLGCSLWKIKKLKQEGRFNEAITQNGRSIMIDAELALQLYSDAM